MNWQVGVVSHIQHSSAGLGRDTVGTLLANTLLVSVINFTVWFAITFYVFLETRSVVATRMIAGLFLTATALTGIWFGGLVDHHRKKTMMQMSALVSLVLYTAALALPAHC